MVLDRVVRAALENLGDLGPLVVDDAVHEEEDPLFLLVPVDLLDARVQVVVPALAALLPHATVQVLGDQRPLLRAVRNDELEDAPVFFGRPGTLHIELFAFSTDAFLW